MNDDPGDEKTVASGLSMGSLPPDNVNDAAAADLRRQQAEFLRAQTALHGLQSAKLETELRRLRADLKTASVAGVRERLKLVLDVGLALVGVALIVLIGMVVWSAARSQSVVVDAFSVPPDFNTQGNTGVVVASGFLDQLTALQRATLSAAAHHHIEDAWSNAIRIDIPETGVSFSEALNYLRSWLGSDIHISGSIVRAGGQVVLTVRGSGIAAKSFTGGQADLPKLTSAAAEYMYGQSEPYLFAVYLSDQGRDRETIAFVEKSYSFVADDQKVNLLTAWGTALGSIGDIPGGIERLRQEIRLDPHAWIAYNNIINLQLVEGDEEGALRTGAEMERMASHPGIFSERVNPLYFQNQEYLRMDLPRVHDEFLSDMKAHGGVGTGTEPDAVTDAEFFARMHDNRAAEIELETSPGAGKDAFVVAQSAFVRGLIRLFAGQYKTAYPLLAVADRAVSQSTEIASNFFERPACFAGFAAEMVGRRAEADADIQRGGHYEDCYRYRADIADHRGQWAQAQADYAAAVALAPSLPAGYFSWGDALMRHRDYRGAAAKFSAANAKGPHWADPLKRWGDALAAMGDLSGAIAKFAAAERYAPRWGSLQIAWGRALDRLGRHDEAVLKYRAALTMDITGDEHWSLRGCCG